MIYNVGDRVKIKGFDWYFKFKNKSGDIPFTITDYAILFSSKMSDFCGQIVTISKKVCVGNSRYYRITEDNGKYSWIDEMIEGLAEENLIERVDDNGLSFNEWLSHKGAFYVPIGYEIKDENGNVINATKIILEKKKKEYPKTYEECCYVLGFENTELVFENDYRDINPPKEQWKRLGLINQFNKLIICRDAYWKIAGEEMGLGKPWEPTMETVYCISLNNNVMKCSYRGGKSNIFEFPTPEMRDDFKENFDKDLEFCKELL